MDNFRGKDLRDLSGVSGHLFRRTGKGKETLEGELVEMSERTDARGVQSVS